jgi:4'-phosphopantetheinyl transferase
MAPSTSSVSPTEVAVWYADATTLLADPGRRARALEWLLAGERDRYDRYRFDTDRRMFLLGRVMARALVGRALGRPPTSWRWREGPRGRPEIGEPDCPLQFNLAHSAGLVICALGRDREIGVDVEDLERPPVDRTLVPRYCSPDEAADVHRQEGGRWHDRFLVYWTLKEAYLKARGLGIAVHLADISFTLGDGSARIGFRESLEGSDTRWTFRLLQPTLRHLVAVAVSSVDGIEPEIRIEPLPLDVIP